MLQLSKINYQTSPNNKGQVSRYVVCDSKMQWANNCPHYTQPVNVLEDDIDKCEKINIVLMTEDLDNSKIFAVEASKSGSS